MAAAVEKPTNLFDIVDTLLLVWSFAGLIELSRNVAAPAGCLSKVQARNSIVLVVLHKFLRYRENFIRVELGLFGFLTIGKCFDIPPGPPRDLPPPWAGNETESYLRVSSIYR